MRSLTRFLMTLTAVLALSGTALAKDADPVALDGSASPAELAAKLVSVSDTSALKGVGKVAIPLFSVQFMTGDQVSAETSGFAAAGRARSTAFYSLVGVDQSGFQALTDGMYRNLVKALQDAGIEVVPAEAVLASPSWRKVAATGVPSPIRNDNAIVVAPPGMTIYGANKMTASSGGGGMSGIFGALSAMGDVAAAIGVAGDTAPMQQELGGATLLEVNLKVHFVQLTNHNKGFWGRLASSAEVSGKAYPSITSASMTVRSATAGSTLTLKNPLALNPGAFSAVREEPKTGGDVAGAILGGLIRMAAGNKDSESSARFQAVADPVRYPEVVGGGLDTVGQMFVARIKAER